MYRKVIALVSVLSIIITASGCIDDVDDRVLMPLTSSLDSLSDPGTEGELLGKIFTGSNRNTVSGYRVHIRPANSDTRNRLHGPEKDSVSVSMEAKPGGWAPKDWDYEWTDPAAGGLCGELDKYEQDSIQYRATERHTSSPNPGKEVHCIRPGKYFFTLTDVGGDTTKTFVVEYIQLKRGLLVQNGTAEESMEGLSTITTSPKVGRMSS